MAQAVKTAAAQEGQGGWRLGPGGSGGRESAWIGGYCKALELTDGLDVGVRKGGQGWPLDFNLSPWQDVWQGAEIGKAVWEMVIRGERGEGCFIPIWDLFCLRFRLTFKWKSQNRRCINHYGVQGEAQEW